MPSLSIPQLISNTATAAGVPPALAVQVATQESSLNPTAMGSKGELGLFQLMPSTATAYGVTDPLDPVQNTQGGVSYLADLFSEFGSWGAALAAYNWGPGNVQNAINQAGANFLSLAPSSTQAYVANALAASGTAGGASAVAAPAAAPLPADDSGLVDTGALIPGLTQTSLAPAGNSGGLLVWVLIGAALFFGAQWLFSES